MSKHYICVDFFTKKIFKEKKIIRFSYKKPFLEKLQWFFTKKREYFRKRKNLQCHCITVIL